MHVQRELFARGEYIIQSLRAHYIRNLMRIGDYGGRSVGDDGAREFGGRNERAFQMNVRIDKARQNDRICHIVFDCAGILADAGDQSLRNGDIAGAKFIAEYV